MTCNSAGAAGRHGCLVSLCCRSLQQWQQSLCCVWVNNLLAQNPAILAASVPIDPAVLYITTQHHNTACRSCQGAWGAPQETEGVSGAEPAHRLHAPGGVQGAARGALHSINARWVVMRSISVWYGAWCCGLLCGASCTCPRQCSGRAAQPRCQVGGAGLRLTSIRCFEIGCLKQLQQHTAHCNASKPFSSTFILHTPQTMHFVLLNFLQQPL